MFENFEVGFEGEGIIRDYLKTVPDCTFGQIDLVAKIKGKWYSFEIKHQDIFEPPPFAGHGLPPWQVKFRLRMYKDCGIIPLFYVVDKKTGVIYYNSLIELEKGKSFLTKTGKRKIYHINNFKILKIKE